ncbi:class I SAM-dependent methyltransferase [Luteibacter sp. Lutesp34]|uniref:class I SAM-dependent methyltransferase n=1 Tax=Luteibacter sp. Lutesp34 TaxID=3243030 RepID=UPI0039B5A95F
MNDLRSTERFSDRVEDYVRYRPDYPRALVDWLHGLGVRPDWLVADVGAGTGISSKLFLDAGHRVTAVEPNAAMRAAAARWLGGEGRYHAVDGTAEATGLPDGSVDLVIAAQAFHWFDRDKVRTEFARILSPHGLVAVFWNSRRLTGTPFLEGYERLLHEYGVDYVGVAERYADDESMARWFGRGYRGMASFPHGQKLDHEALLGRLMSSSYAPKPGHPNHEPMLHALRALFDATQDDGTVSFDYDTRVFAGRTDA